MHADDLGVRQHPQVVPEEGHHLHASVGMPLDRLPGQPVVLAFPVVPPHLVRQRLDPRQNLIKALSEPLRHRRVFRDRRLTELLIGIARHHVLRKHHRYVEPHKYGNHQPQQILIPYGHAPQPSAP